MDDSAMSTKADIKNRLEQHRSEILEHPCVFNSLKLKHYKAKEVIYNEGDRVDGLYVIDRGLVKLLSYLPTGRARIVRLHSVLHWLALEGLTNCLYEHTAVAVGDVELLHIPMQSLKQLKELDPDLFFNVMGQFHQHLEQADKWISEFSTGGIKPRVARLLEYLSDLEYGDGSGRVDLLTVHEMADVLGVTPESVSRILAEFKRGQILEDLHEKSADTYEINKTKLDIEADG